MRYIDTSAIAVPANWIDLAKAKLGPSYQSLWSYFKEGFENLSTNKKCWYSESRNVGAFNPIDHFRPKSNKVKSLTKRYVSLHKSIWDQIDSKARNGYNFLTFEFSNYRYACDIVNTSTKRGTKDNKTKGKSNFFPLKRGSSYGTTLADTGEENICLLDPCNAIDSSYLTFNELGLVKPHVSILKSSWEYCRVMVSIEIYHLEYPSFVEGRVETWDFCQNRIVLANPIILKPEKTVEEVNALSNYIKDINERMNKKSEYSAVAVDCVSFLKSKYSWLENLFPGDIQK